MQARAAVPFAARLAMGSPPVAGRDAMTSNTFLLTRRSALSSMVASGGLLLVGCSPSGGSDPGSEQKPAIRPAAAAVSGAAMTVFRDPSCGCCKAWADIARQAGYHVTLREDQDMAGLKRRLGVPEALASCHTAHVNGLVVEGHVPLEDVERLLRERPSGVKGIAVPGMPVGSPGMEVPDGTRQPFQVIAFDATGNMGVFRG